MTHIIPQARKYGWSYNHATNEQHKENELTKAAAMKAFIEFLGAVATEFKKGWYIALDGQEIILVNGHSLPFQFYKKDIQITNGMYSRYEKMLAVLTFDKELTMKDHGAKVARVIQDLLDRSEQQREASMASTNNGILGAYVMKSLIKDHGFVLYDNATKMGYEPPMMDKEYFGLRYRYKSSGFTFKYFPNDGATQIEIIDRISETGLDGTYIDPSGLALAANRILDYASHFQTEFNSLVSLVPKIVEVVRELASNHPR